MESMSLKALANKVLDRNSLGNSKETQVSNDGNSEVLVSSEVNLAYKVYSKILTCYLWVVYRPKDIKELRDQGFSESIYTTAEVNKLKGMDSDSLRAINSIKEIFDNSTVEEIRRGTEGK